MNDPNIKPTKTEVIRVRNRNGKEILISPDDFDPERYERVEESTAKVSEEVVVEEVKVVMDPFSNEEENDLLTWTRVELRKLPEYKYIDKPPRDKNGIVTAIMEVRERRKNGEL